MAEWTTEQIHDLNGKIFLITGANSGLGFESAKVLASKGGRVIMACRNLEKGGEAVRNIQRYTGGYKPDLRELDLADLKSVERFVAGIRKDYNRIDVLMNNAGIMATPYGKTKQGFEAQIGINHLGHFALTGMLFDRLANRPGSRIVNLSSIASRRGRMNFEDLMGEKRYRPMEAYRQTKLANLLFTLELDRRIRDHGIGMMALAAHPGIAATNLHKAVRANETLKSLYEKIFLKLLPGAEQGARSQLYAATSSDVVSGKYYGPSGWFEFSGSPGEAAIPLQALDQESATRLWAISEQLTGVRFDYSPSTG